MDKRTFVHSICLLAIASLVGCSEAPTRFPVAGTVLIDGKPLPTGSIQFVPAEGRPVAGKILSDGSFRLTQVSVSNSNSPAGVAPGKYRVGISSSIALDEDQGKIHRHIPAHYADFRTSGLEQEITKAEENLVINLTWEGAEEYEDASDASDEVEGSGNADETGDVTDTGAAEPAAEPSDPATEAEKEE